MTLCLTLLPRLRTLSSEPYNFTMLLICEWTHSALAFGIRKEKEDYGEIGTLSRILLVASEWPKHPRFRSFNRIRVTQALSVCSFHFLCHQCMRCLFH